MKKLLISLGLLCVVFSIVPAAHASSITYTFTGLGPIAGTSFSYLSPAGFLAFDTGVLAPTTSSDLFISNSDIGKLTGFDFISANEFKLYTASGPIDVGVPTGYQIGALTAGESLNIGILTISAATVAATPEPSSLLMLGTGIVGLAGSLRRKLLVG